MSWLGVPLVVHGQVIGTCGVQSYTVSDLYTQNDVESFQSVSWLIASAIERKLAIEALKRSEERYRTIFEQSRDAIYITRPGAPSGDFNQAALDLFGYTDEEISTLEIEDLYVDPKERERNNALLLKQGFINDFELTLRRKDGAVIIDVGVNRVPDPSVEKGYRLVGDVQFEQCRDKASFITPVPGGVGPMTIAMLMANTVTAAERHAKIM